MRNLSIFALLFMAIFIVSAGAREARILQKTCPVLWPMVPCDAKKCEEMCRDYYGPVTSYCNRVGTPIAECACNLTDC
ncbi:PREDICTED: defensin-like protein 201 [Camelina sativa]|uniref:Defensin-like protein 201 n=1 Tax=Camelina sativa TaxID=90675 RepID=A0ABM1RDD6_CAMSA|nr:PREDICTED: defensin-like protein 201 [Camelina sativa]